MQKRTLHTLLTSLLVVALGFTGMDGKSQVVTGRLDLGRKDPKPMMLEYVSADDGLVTLGAMSRKSSRYLGLSKYNGAFEREWSQQVLAQNGRANIDQMAVLGDKILVFISEYIPRKKSIETSFSQLDMNGNIVFDREIISEDPNDQENRVSLNYIRSINKKKLLAYKNLNNNNEREKIIYFLFDSNNEEVLRGEIELPHQDDSFQVRKIAISNSGTIYVLGKYYRVNRVKQPNDYAFKLYRFQAGDNRLAEVDLGLDDTFITDLTLKIDPQENTFLAGYYSKRSSSAIIGTAYFRLNPDLGLEVSALQRFPDDFLNRFMSDRQIDRGRELRDFYLDNIVLRSDGGVLLIGERYYTVYNSYMDVYGYWVDQRIHHYDDIIVNSVSPDGGLEWAAVAPKRQSSEIRDHLSYLDVVSGASLFLIYGYEPRRAPSTLYYNAVSMDGEVSDRSILLDIRSTSDLFFPRNSLQISNTEALLVYYQDREKVYSVVRVEF